MQILKKSLLLLACTLMLASCSDYEVAEDSQTKGNITISVDETYKPVMEEQLKIFLGRFPDAHIIAEYKPEADCFKDFFEDSTRVIFVTRELSEEEIKYCESKKFFPKSLPMVRDAVAFITSPKNANPQFTIAQIKDILTGKDNTYQIVFDNKNSSTVRYINDSLIPGQKLSEKITATNNCEEVIDYVSKHDNSIGVIGVSWVADRKDSSIESFLKKVNVAAIMPDNDSIREYVKPYQAFIGLREYPCTRNLYFISKENWQGLGTGFVNYLCRDGQIIFKQAKMFPLRVNILLRETNIKH